MENFHLKLPIYFLQHLDVVWTFFLLVSRFTAMFLSLPGIGGGVRGLMIRMPAVFVLSAVSLKSSPTAPLPENLVLLFVELAAEFLLGFVVGIIPAFVIHGAQMGATLASNTMGLGMAQMIDPSSGQNMPSLAKLQGDLMMVLFLLLGGHYYVLEAISGLNGHIAPGMFTLEGASISLLIDLTSAIFKAGVMISAPVMIALLLAQFVMGIISKSVPTVNIFIISFPLTIGIGLILSGIALPEVARYAMGQFYGVENGISAVIANSAAYK
ncbi:MAG: hypothetical protein D6808_02845 [Candidatus Dadabacteria bacterium]|nr:MAG: hypothetical protein D6808_02845 [Candidatus Dadabacteria bacterium]